MRSSFSFFFIYITKQKAKVTCNPRLGELRDYGCLAQGQLSQTSERRKVPYDFLMKIIPGYQSKIQSLPKPSGGKQCRTFPFWIASATAQPYPWQREAREGDITCPRWTPRLMEGKEYLAFPILDCIEPSRCPYNVYVYLCVIYMDAIYILLVCMDKTEATYSKGITE